ncbi:MAG: hypothetical protein ACI8R4_003000 [Paracoccaceae bacterium]|jgi:hypothetical protein
MRKSLILILMAGLLVAGCGGWGDSRANPRNWFGKSSPAATTLTNTGETNALIPKKSSVNKRPDAEDRSEAIGTITELRVEPTPIGAIIYVSGVASRQGAFDTELRLDPIGEGADTSVLSYTFYVVYPDYQTAVSTERSRTVIDALSLTHQELQGVRLIRVSGAQNALETRRR